MTLRRKGRRRQQGRRKETPLGGQEGGFPRAACPLRRHTRARPNAPVVHEVADHHGAHGALLRQGVRDQLHREPRGEDDDAWLPSCSLTKRGLCVFAPPCLRAGGGEGLERRRVVRLATTGTGVFCARANRTPVRPFLPRARRRRRRRRPATGRLLSARTGVTPF